MKNTIFCDFFGVISSEVAPVWFERHFAPADAKRLKADICSRADIGRINEKQWYQEMERVSLEPWESIKRDFYDLVKIDERMVDFLISMREKYSVYLLSNAPSSFIHNVLKRYELYSCFDELFISAELRLAKPSGEYFKYALKHTGKSAAEVVMVDDNRNNIRGANEVGIAGIVYTDFDKFKSEIKKYFDID